MENGRPESEGLAAKTVRGSAYSITASAVTMVLGFGRSVLMARLLTPEDFGVVAFAMTFLNFTMPLRDFGLDQALIHRQPDEKQPLDEALAVHFSLRLVLICVFVLLLLIFTPVLRYSYPQKTLLVPVLLALTVGEVASALGATPTTYLRKEMRFRELAVLRVLTSLVMTIVGPLMAWQGWGVWAIVGERISGLGVVTVVVWAFIRPWRLRWKLDWQMVKWYLGYGKFVFVSGSLTRMLDQFDDFWIGTALGPQALGFYSKAYEYAGYPRRVISEPIVQVLFPTFAQLQDDRLRLSKAYFRVSSLIVRVGFLSAGSLVLAAPELIVFLLGDKWSPMTPTFQLMVVYALLDPFFSISGKLVNAIGRPDFTTRARIVQGLFFVPAVVLSAYWGGINGVALVTDAMLLLGLTILLRQLRKLVDISFRKMFAVPLLALIVGALIGWGAESWIGTDVDILTLGLRIAGFVLGYGLVLVSLERQGYLAQLGILTDLLLVHDVRTTEEE
jgi:O-antigen/teichoic acid export membrane protein